MLIRSIEALNPKMQGPVLKLMDLLEKDQKLKDLGANGFIISETYRELATQLIYFMRGRMQDPEDVQKAYIAALGWAPSSGECKNKITWTLASKHLLGMAIDIVPSKDGKNYWWTAPKEIWKRMGEVGNFCGLNWGGDWKGKEDVPHFEI